MMSKTNTICKFIALFLLFLACLFPTQKATSQDIDTVPLFQLFQPEQSYLATLCIGSGTTPGIGLLGSLSTLVSGDDAGFNLWSFAAPFSSRRDKTLLATCGLILMPAGSASSGIETIGFLKIGDEEDFWSLINSDVVRPIPDEFLERVKDEKPISGPSIDDLEASAYYEFVLMAYQTSALAFAQSARKDLTFSDLMTKPRTNRGEVVEIKGRLRRLRKITPPVALLSVGISELYEGWVFQEMYGPNPVCILFTQLPDNIQPFEKDDFLIEFQGYFFKKYRYKTANSGSENPWKDTPLVIGKTLNVTRGSFASSEEGSTWAKGLLPLFTVSSLIVLTGIIGLIIWFLRGDQKTSNRLRNRRLEVDPIFKDYSTTIGNQIDISASKLPENDSGNSKFPGYRI